METQESELKSPDSVSSKSFSSEEGGSVGEEPPAQETQEHSQDTQSASEGGYIQCTIIMTFRFDTLYQIQKFSYTNNGFTVWRSLPNVQISFSR